MITGWLQTDTIVTMFISAKEAHQSMLKIFARIVSNHFDEILHCLCKCSPTL